VAKLVQTVAVAATNQGGLRECPLLHPAAAKSNCSGQSRKPFMKAWHALPIAFAALRYSPGSLTSRNPSLHVAVSFFPQRLHSNDVQLATLSPLQPETGGELDRAAPIVKANERRTLSHDGLHVRYLHIDYCTSRRVEQGNLACTC
jgi:hypothetical protein